MKNHVCRCAFVFCGWLLIAVSSLAQKVPVVIQAPVDTNQDQTAIKFSRSLSDEIQLSAQFYYWQGKDDLPPNAVRIMVRSIKVQLDKGSELGSAIFVEADRPSTKDPGYYKVIAEQRFMIPKNVSVADETRGFLADVDRNLKRTE
jgi:hypothetical protein